jgi:multidrug efflux system membrane fusion protein
MNYATTALACLLAVTLIGCGRKAEEGGARHQAAPVVTGVVTQEVQSVAIPDQAEAVGTVRARTSAVVMARIPGTVTAIFAREGDRVLKGKVLLSLEAQEGRAGAAGAVAMQEEARRGLDEARAHKKLADATFERFQKLFQEQAISRQEFDVRQMEKEVAAQGVARAEARLAQAREGAVAAGAVAGYARVTAPISGVITAKPVELGATVFPSVPLMTIEDERDYRLEVAAPESLAPRIRAGQQVSYVIDGAGISQTGKVVEVVPAADPASRTVLVKIAIPSGKVRSGMYGRAYFPLGETTGILVPRQAVVERGALTSVWVVDKEKIARMRLVRTGRTIGERIELISGLTTGERIVTGGMERVADGALIQ